jgi:hypothetical protein
LLFCCAALTDLAKIARLAKGTAILRRHKTLIPPKNVLYIEKMDRNDVATGALPIREHYFSVAEFHGFQFRGRAIHA